MTLGGLARLAAISFIAAIMASLSFVGLVFLAGETLDTMMLPTVTTALLGSYAIGFPVALLTFQFSGRHMAQSPSELVMIAALSGAVLVMASYAIADREGAYWLGLPSVAAVMAFAGLGWLWIVRPMRKDPK